jgi:hypothetical protein
MSSVADPGCLSRIPDPDNFPSRMPDPTTIKRGKKSICSLSFFVAINLTKLKMITFLNRYRNRFESNDEEFKYFNPQTFFYVSSHNSMGWIWDP